MIQSRYRCLGLVVLFTMPLFVVQVEGQEKPESTPKPKPAVQADQPQEKGKPKQSKLKQGEPERRDPANEPQGADSPAKAEATKPDPLQQEKQSDASEAPSRGVKLVVVVGADGEDVYGEQFTVWAQRWRAIATQNKIDFSLIRGGEKDGETDLQRLQKTIEAIDEKTEAFWLVLIGHGTDDRKRSKFNLIGPDVSALQLDGWLSSVECPVAVINCASCSGAFIAKLKGDNRVIVSSTRSGAQYNFARFGNYFSQAISDPSLDLDKDQQTSLLEAFIAASQQTQDYYVQEKRLASELALIEDNGDGLGTPGDWFAGTRVVKQAADATVKPDGRIASRMVLVPNELEASLTAEQRKMRDQLELKLEELRASKADMEELAYFAKLEAIMFELAKIYESD